ncbi:hypothetical protein [Rummeliibacillus suwonensis]|uniref:hypothetical protein n=1 Tax=Rummeliibacillus suwonensis TaxID=1306154 RepID=UPI002899BD49|nr:hypothetical protein [Rummeliibacillus suwonensis]
MGINCRLRLIGSGGQNVGPSGVAIGRGIFHFRSSISVGIKKTPTDGSFTLFEHPVELHPIGQKFFTVVFMQAHYCKSNPHLFFG